MKARHFSGLIYPSDFCTTSPCGNIVGRIVATEQFNRELQNIAERKQIFTDIDKEGVFE